MYGTTKRNENRKFRDGDKIFFGRYEHMTKSIEKNSFSLSVTIISRTPTRDVGHEFRYRLSSLLFFYVREREENRLPSPPPLVIFLLYFHYNLISTYLRGIFHESIRRYLVSFRRDASAPFRRTR